MVQVFSLFFLIELPSFSPITDVNIYHSFFSVEFKFLLIETGFYKKC